MAVTESDPDDVPWIVSVDDHVVEPPTMFQRWLPARYRGQAKYHLQNVLTGITEQPCLAVVEMVSSAGSWDRR